jgi:hypothetical protein
MLLFCELFLTVCRAQLVNPTITGTLTLNQSLTQGSAVLPPTNLGTGIPSSNTILYGNGVWGPLPQNILPTQASVAWYGAVGNGTTDDTAAIQAAINATVAASGGKGGILYIPAGFTCKTSAPLVIPAGVSGFILEGQGVQDNASNSQILYTGPTTLPAVVFAYTFTGAHSGFQLTTGATIAGANSSATTIVAPAGWLASGSETGTIGNIHGTLSVSAGVYTFTRGSAGLTTTWVAGLDCYVPDSVTGSQTYDRASMLRNLSINGNGNVCGVLLQGHGSAEGFDHVYVNNVSTCVQINQQPANGNLEFISFYRCNFQSNQYGLAVYGGDSFCITVYDCSIGVNSGTAQTGPLACIRVLNPLANLSQGNNGAGFYVYGGNIGIGGSSPNMCAALEFTGVGDPIAFNGVRSEGCAVALRINNNGGTGRNVTFRDCSFAGMNQRTLTAWAASTVYQGQQFLTNGGNTYRVVSGGTSSASSGPTTTTKANETNGSMTVAYVAPTQSQSDYASWSYIVEAASYQSGDTSYTQTSGGHTNVVIDNCVFSINNPNTNPGGLAVDQAQFLSLREKNTIFSGRLFENTSSNASFIHKEQCSYSIWSGPSQFIFDQDEAGAPENLLTYNSNPNTGGWTIGSNVTVANTSTNPPYLPAMGGNAFRLTTSGSAYDTTATTIYQNTTISSSSDTGNDGYVITGGVPFGNSGTNQYVVVNVTDQNGYLLAKGIYGAGTQFALPFEAYNSSLTGNIQVSVGAMTLNGGSNQQGTVTMLQIGRNRDHTYVQTGPYAIDGYNLLHRDESSHGTVSAGRLIIPNTDLGGVVSGPYDLRTGDVIVNSNQLSFFDGVQQETLPRTFYQSGTTAPTTGIWRVGDQVLATNPTAGGYIGLVCTVAGGFTATGGFAPGDYGAWAATTAVRLSDYRYTVGNNIYKCVVPGTTASSAPSATSGFVNDGTVWWQWVGSIASPTFKTFGAISM